MSAESTRVTQQVLAGTHPDVTVLTTNKVTIGIDQVREIITTSEQMPPPRRGASSSSKTWIVCLSAPPTCSLKEIEEPAEHCIWLLARPAPRTCCPPSARAHASWNLAVPSTQAVAGFLTSTTNVEQKWRSVRARLAEGHIGIAKLYATDERVMSDRDELVVGVLNLARCLGCSVVGRQSYRQCQAQAEADANRITAGQEAEFRRINGLAPSDRIPPKLGVAHSTRLPRKTSEAFGHPPYARRIDRALNSIASIYRDVAVLQNNAEDSVGPINLENRSSITELSVRIEPGRCRDPSGRSGLRPQAPSRQRQPATGISSPSSAP